MADSVARLLEFAEDHLRDAGVTQVRVETLGDSVEYEPYEWTRAFYRAMGFSEFKLVMTDNPAAGPGVARVPSSCEVVERDVFQARGLDDRGTRPR